MADWTDGAEYAPLERPDGFATPRVAPLALAESTPSPADGQPTVQPDDYLADPGRLPLDALVPAPPSPRDPSQPFEVAMPEVETSWGAVHASGPNAWHPTQPLGPSDALVVGGQGSRLDHFAPPTGAPVAAPGMPEPGMSAPGLPGPTGQWGPAPTTGDPLGAGGWAALGCLGLGLLAQSLALGLLLVASFLPLRSATLRAKARGLYVLIGFVVLMAWLADSAQLTFEPILGDVAQLACAAQGLALAVMARSERKRSSQQGNQWGNQHW